MLTRATAPAGPADKAPGIREIGRSRRDGRPVASLEPPSSLRQEAAGAGR